MIQYYEIELLNMIQLIKWVDNAADGFDYWNVLSI